jgi:hypothetical protein
MAAKRRTLRFRLRRAMRAFRREFYAKEYAPLTVELAVGYVSIVPAEHARAAK